MLLRGAVLGFRVWGVGLYIGSLQYHVWGGGGGVFRLQIMR